VENIELILLAYLSHLDGKRQSIIGTREQTALTDSNLMEVNSRRRKIEPNRLGVAKEMNGVAEGGEFGAERGCKNPLPRSTGNR
jgi:hypothetical protein